MLRNKLGITDRELLVIAETDRSDTRSLEIFEEPSVLRVGDSFGADRLRAIHRYLFQDVYAWAGEYRTVGIAKGLDQHFASPDIIDELVVDLVGAIAERAASDLATDAIGFLVDTYARLNYIHPFREGNGRVQRMYGTQLVERHGRTLDWSRVSADENNEAFKDSMDGDRASLRTMLNRILI
ncbi:Fic family protein [Agrococcus sp. ARC_14]|uniref:Fic/DOC family protein n=1 Tax=Agrococcus sp. ARC_14 TaxID=2919927 RepID=UPI001F06BFDA|nr:Fic family protein [Agrococcus sp. ARC_14]